MVVLSEHGFALLLEVREDGVWPVVLDEGGSSTIVEVEAQRVLRLLHRVRTGVAQLHDRVVRVRRPRVHVSSNRVLSHRVLELLLQLSLRHGRGLLLMSELELLLREALGSLVLVLVGRGALFVRLVAWRVLRHFEHVLSERLLGGNPVVLFELTQLRIVGPAARAEH